MSDLDQAALEAAAKAMHANWYAKSAHYYKAYAGTDAPTWENDTKKQRAYYIERAEVAIRAYQQAMAAQVIEAVEAK